MSCHTRNVKIRAAFLISYQIFASKCVSVVATEDEADTIKGIMLDGYQNIKIKEGQRSNGNMLLMIRKTEFLHSAFLRDTKRPLRPVGSVRPEGPMGPVMPTGQVRSMSLMKPARPMGPMEKVVQMRPMGPFRQGLWRRWYR